MSVKLIIIPEKPSLRRRVVDGFQKVALDASMEALMLGVYAATRAHEILGLKREWAAVRLAREIGYYRDEDEKKYTLQEIGDLTGIDNLETLFNSKPETPVTIFRTSLNDWTISLDFEYEPFRKRSPGLRLLDLAGPGFNLNLYVVPTRNGGLLHHHGQISFLKDRSGFFKNDWGVGRTCIPFEDYLAEILDPNDPEAYLKFLKSMKRHAEESPSSAPLPSP